MTNTPPIYNGAPDFTTVDEVSELSQYLSYAALPNINIDEDWFNLREQLDLLIHLEFLGRFNRRYRENNIKIRKNKIRLFGGGSAAFVCNDNSGVNILQNLVPPNYSTNGYSARLCM